MYNVRRTKAYDPAERKGVDALVKNMKYYMKLQDISSKQLAGGIKLSEAYVSQIVNFYVVPSLTTIDDIASFLGVKIIDLLFEERDYDNDTKTIFWSLSGHNKRKVLDYAKYLRDRQAENKVRR